MATPKFIDSKGFCTSYAHGCGYLDSASVPNVDDSQAITMGREGAVYFVKARAYNGHANVWEVYDIEGGRVNARREFLRLIKERNGIRKIGVDSSL